MPVNYPNFPGGNLGQFGVGGPIIMPNMIPGIPNQIGFNNIKGGVQMNIPNQNIGVRAP